MARAFAARALLSHTRLNRGGQALSCGAVPVVIGDGWVLPFSEAPLDYSTLVLCVPEEPHALAALPAMLRTIPVATVAEYQRAGRAAFEDHLGTLDAQAKTLLAILAKRRTQSRTQRHEHQTTDSLAAKSVIEQAAAAAHERAARPAPAPAAVGAAPLDHGTRRTPTLTSLTCSTRRSACRSAYRRLRPAAATPNAVFGR
jgi:hypothetical protein